jgi:hypothetical protein
MTIPNRTAAFIVLAVFSATAVSAQKVTVPPNLNAPTTPITLGQGSTFIWQSMMVPYNTNKFTFLKLRFWFDGSPRGNKNYYTMAGFGGGRTCFSAQSLIRRPSQQP